MEKVTDYKDASTYNNFYEFGTDKADPARNAHTLKTTPWTVEVEGLVKKPAKYALEDLLKLSARKSASTACAAWRAGPW
jgi:sulfoxide reductase catalytic subunit YedY